MMEENNLQPDSEVIEAVATPLEEHPIVATEPEMSTEQIPVTPENLPMVAPPKKKKSMLLGAVAALLVLATVGGYALLMTPERVIGRAIVKQTAQGSKETVAFDADFPIFAKSAELSKGSHVSDLSLVMNMAQITDVPPSVMAGFGGARLEGSTISDRANGSYQNTYGITVLGRKLGTLELYAAPNELAVGVPSHLSNTYTINMDELVERGADSYIFGKMFPTDKQGLATFADTYKEMMDASVVSFDPAQNAEMGLKMQTILTDGMANAVYGTAKEDGQKRYTVTVPAADVKTTVTALMQYVYVDSPMGQKLAAQPGAAESIFPGQVDEICAQIAANLPDAPLVISMEIKSGNILSAHLLLDGTAVQPDTAMIDAQLEIPDGKTAKITTHIIAGKGEQRSDTTVLLDTGTKDRVLTVTLDVQNKTPTTYPVFLQMNLMLDNKLEKNNLNFDLTFGTEPPAAREDGFTFAMGCAGDYLLQGDGILLDLRETNYNLTLLGGTASFEMGMRLATAPYTKALVAPKGQDVLAMTEGDTITLATELQLALAKILGGQG